MRALVAGAPDWRGAPGITPGPGGPGTAGLPAAPPAIGGSPPVAGPFCAIASVVPATSSAATIVRLFGVVIIIPPSLSRTRSENAFIKLPVPVCHLCAPGLRGRGVAAIIVWMADLTSGGERRSTALDTLNQRFARGEIDRAEYEEKRKLIGR
jgi:Short C-terminal domain